MKVTSDVERHMQRKKIKNKRGLQVMPLTSLNKVLFYLLTLRLLKFLAS